MSIPKLTLLSVATMLKLGLLGAASLTALLLPLTPANAGVPDALFKLLARSATASESQIGNLARTERLLVMGTAVRTGSRFEAGALRTLRGSRFEAGALRTLRGNRSEAGALRTLRRDTPAPQMGAKEIEGESLGGLNRANKSADELPSAKPAGELAPARNSFDVLSGKLKVGTMMRFGNFEINGGEIKLYKGVTVAGVVVYCNTKSCSVEAMKELLLGSLKAGE